MKAGTKVASPDRSEIAGAAVYTRNCAICHGDDLLGAPSNYPGSSGSAKEFRTRKS